MQHSFWIWVVLAFIFGGLVGWGVSSASAPKMGNNGLPTVGVGGGPEQSPNPSDIFPQASPSPTNSPTPAQAPMIAPQASASPVTHYNPDQVY